jgi:hypothetical protein
VNATRASDADDLAEGSLIGDHFRIVRKLGGGGMGDVYLAENANLPDKRYAVKVLRATLSAIPQYERLLQGEAQRQARLEHEHIVGLYDYFRWGSRHCLVLAYVEGGTLADLIAAAPGGMPEPRALDLMLEILEGLNHAHEHGVLHCDIKPENVLVDREQRVRVTDFGIARDLSTATAQRSGAVVGTPEYMSPEQITDAAHVDHRTDVYSAGVVLFEMLTGRLPFVHEGQPGGMRFPQTAQTPASILDLRPRLSPRLARIVATALQRAPAARFQGCMAFQQAIVGYRHARRWRRTWLPALAVTGLVAIAGAIGSAHWKHTLEQRAEIARRENAAQARRTAEALIADTAKQMNALCREALRLRTREAAVVTAGAAGFDDLVPKLQAQVDDLRRNVADYARGYAERVAQLASFDDALVAQLMDALPPDADAARALGTVRADHADAAAKRPPRPAAAVVAGCPG